MDNLDYPGDDIPRLTVREGFDAMRSFLEAYWERGKGSDDVRSVLSDIDCSLTADGGPIDRAQWSDWLEAVSKAQGQARGERH